MARKSAKKARAARAAKSGKESKRSAAKTARIGRKKVCHFCKEKITYVDFKDMAMLRRFVSERGKIRARRVTGTCSQHQRLVATAVKNAREVALLPYVSR